MQSLVDIRKVAQDFVVTATGLAGSKVIWANQGTARPAKPYVLLNFINGINDAAPRPSESMPLNSNPSEQRELVLSGGTMTLSVNGYDAQYPEAFDLIHSIKGDLINDVKRATLKQKQLDVVTVDTVIDNHDYSVTIDDVKIKITSDASATDLEIRDALVTAINASSFINTTAQSTDDDDNPLADNILWVRNFPGVEFNFALSAELSFVQTNAVNLTYLNNTGVINLSQLLETEIEGRAQIDIIFATPLRTTDKPSIIETVEVTNELDGTTTVMGA